MMLRRLCQNGWKLKRMNELAIGGLMRNKKLMMNCL